MNGIKLGFAITGSFCTIDRIMLEMRKLIDSGAELVPILSYNAASTDTRFGKAEQLKAELTQLTGHKPLETLVEVEPIGPKEYFDALVVAPCTGTTLGRLANGLSDTPVTLAVKSHLRRSLPVILGISTNDALGASMRNVALLKNTKHLYLIPMRQDDPVHKPNSLVADFSLLKETIKAAQNGIQLNPMLIY